MRAKIYKLNRAETYFNVKSLMEKVDVQGIKYAFSQDLKMYLILLGKQSASCTHPCPFCTGRKPWTDKCADNTIGSLNINYENFLSSGADLKEVTDLW